MATTTPDYGTDLDCGPDLTDDMRVTSGRRLVAQNVLRRFNTPRGSLPDDQNYGLDLSLYLNDDLGPGDIGRIGSSMQAEAVKDARIKTARATVALGSDGNFTATLTLVDANGPFTLVLGVSGVGVTLLQGP